MPSDSHAPPSTHRAEPEPKRASGPVAASTRAAQPAGYPAALLQLQGMAGNAAVARVLRERRAGGGATSPAKAGQVLQRSPGEIDADDLLLHVEVAGNTLSWAIPVADLGPPAVADLRREPMQINEIEARIIAAMHDAAGPLHESSAFVMSPPVVDDLRRDVTDWPTKHSLDRFANRMRLRAAALRATRLRYPLEQYLESTSTLQPWNLDWKAEVAALRGTQQAPDKTMIDASRADRFELALNVLDSEADPMPQPAGAVPLHTEVLGRIIYARYAATDPAPSELATDDMTRTHSEAFLALWLPKIRDVRFVPDGFVLGAFAPTGDLDPVRKGLVDSYIKAAAPRTMEKFLLDSWVADSGTRSPEQFIQTTDINKLRGRLLEWLVKDFQRWAPTQPGFRGAFWSDVGQRAAFTSVSTLVMSGRAIQSFHATLADRFETVGPENLSPEEYAVAEDPYGYSEKITSAATTTSSLIANLKPGDMLEHGLQAWYDAVASTWAPGTDDARPVSSLLALFAALGGLKSAIEAQQTATRQQISFDLDTSYEKIATIIRNEARTAEEFITSKWIPMLKVVALEQVTANRDEMKSHLANWSVYRAEAAAKFRISAHLLNDLIDRLTSGDIESIELDGQILTVDHLEQLTHARDFMQGEADTLADDDDAEDKRDDLQEAVEGFEKVRKRILDGDYKPIDYTSAVYKEARRRLGIDWYEDYTTFGMMLDRWAVVPQNPFLAYSIARWQWEEHVKELDHSFKMFILLGLLTVASLIVPGAAGIVLAGLDMAVGIAQGIGAVSDAYALLDMARLDSNGTVRGVTVEQAKKALTTAWIGLGLNLIMIAGIGTLWGRLVMKGRGATKIPGELTNLAALAKVNPIAAEKMMAKVKDLTKLEELLTATGDSLLLERMLEKTTDIRHLEYALMHGSPAKIGELIELAGDAGKLGKVLDHVPDALTAERLLRLTDDADGLAVLLRTADNPGIAEKLLQWTDPQTASRMLGLSGDQAGLVKLSESGLSPATALKCLPKAEDAAQLNRLVARMDKGPEQLGTLLEKRTATEVEGMLDRGARPSDVDVGVGAPGMGPQPTFLSQPTAVPADVRALLNEYGLGTHPMFATVEPFELRRIRATIGNNRLPAAARPILQDRAVAWALDGARSPAEFANRWEYLKGRFDSVRKGIDPTTLARGESLDVAAARQLGSDAGVVGMEAQLAADRAVVRDLAGAGWVDIGGTPGVINVRGSATKLSFGSEIGASYHFRKHGSEIALAEAAAPGASAAEQASAYIASARRTITEGQLVSSVEAEGVTTMVFTRTVKGPGGKLVQIDTMVLARDNWALIATHGKTMRK